MEKYDLLIDYRETNLIKNLKIPFKSENLDVGDILFKSINNDNILLIERKTYSDLANAIQTGRHKEQKARIHAFNSKIKIYLIEGEYDRHSKIPESTLDSAILGMIIRDGMNIINSRSSVMTCQIITKIYEKLDLYLTERNNIYNGIIDYDGPVKIIKKENLTEKSCYISQLCCYHGISNKIAEEIYKSYKNFSELLTASTNDLSDIEIVSDEGKIKKLGIIGNKLYDYLHYVEIINNPKKIIIKKKQ